MPRRAAGQPKSPGAVVPSSGSTNTTANVIITSQGDPEMIVGSGHPATRSWDLADFNAVEIAQSFRAEVTRARAFKVTLTADDNILEHVEAVRKGSTLRVSLKKGNYRLSKRPHLSITMPVLEEIGLGGAAHATIQGFESDRPFRSRVGGASTLDGSIRAGHVQFDASGASTLKLTGASQDARLLASGASKLELGGFELKSEKLLVDLSGASSISARGAARAAVLKAQGASHLRLADLTLEAADVAISGASDATIRVKGLLDYELSAASRLEYYGEPTLGKARRSGASSVTHR